MTAGPGGPGMVPPLLPGAFPPEVMVPAEPVVPAEAVAPAEPAPGGVEELREEIEHTRAELGETLEALAAKADVKARLHDAADDAKERIRERVHDVAERTGGATGTVRRYRGPLLALGGALVAVLVFLRWRRGRRT